MKPSDTVKWGIRGIRQRKMRAALTILGIMIGTASVIALVSQTQGIQSSILGQIDKLGPNTITIRPSSTTITLSQSDVDRISQIPGVESVVPVVASMIKIYSAGTSKSFTLVGVKSTQFPLLIDGSTIHSGRLYQSMSYSEIFVGSNVIQPQDMTSPFLTVGQSATIEIGVSGASKKIVQVVGALDEYGAASAVSVDDSVFMSLEGALNLVGQNTYSSLFIKTDDPDNVDSVVYNIKAYYGTNLNIITVKQITTVVSTITNMLTVLLGAIAAISLFVAGIGIANIMFVSVIERTREIGILKALGFRNNNVLAIFLSEAVLMGALGGVLGIALGTVISYLMPLLLSSGVSRGEDVSSGLSTSTASMGSFTYSPVIGPEIMIFVLAFAIVVALFAGLLPARRASRMDPVVALRHD